MRTWVIRIVVGLCCVGCTAPKQTAGELQAGLFWFVPAGQAEGWRTSPADPGSLLPFAPVIVAWTPVPSHDGEPVVRPPKATRESWIEVIRTKLQQSGAAATAAPPDTFDDGPTLEGIRTLAASRQARVVVLFGVELNRRRFNTSEPYAASPLKNTLEILATARSVGMTPEGRPVFTEVRVGFDSETRDLRSVDEVEDVAIRVALEGMADATARRLRMVLKEAEGTR